MQEAQAFKVKPVADIMDDVIRELDGASPHGADVVFNGTESHANVMLSGSCLIVEF